MFDYRIAKSAEDYKSAAILFKEYADWLNIDLSFQQFDEELAELTKMYASPGGGLILCRHKGDDIACVALRRINSDIAELKRMYVKPTYRGHGIGRIMLVKALELARVEKYTRIRLDTLAHMKSAIELYKQNGFYEIPPYYHNPNSTALYFEVKC